MNTQYWITKINNWAESKGWHDKPLVLEHELMNFHTEISEAWEEIRKGKSLLEIYYTKDSEGVGRSFFSINDFTDVQMGLARNGAKPEGFAVEVADLVIRILHSAGYHEVDIVSTKFEEIWDNVFLEIGREMLVWHKFIGENQFNKDFGFNALLQRIFAFCKHHEICLEKYVVLKMIYNETREYRHGGKIA